MAHKAESFKLNEKKQTIVIYTNVEPTKAEQGLIDFYLGRGYAPMLEEKKAGKGIEDMREEMKDDPETLKKFNDTYANKDDKKAFFKACKIYSDWAKAQKKAK